jgi:hypothetical protein
MLPAGARLADAEHSSRRRQSPEFEPRIARMTRMGATGYGKGAGTFFFYARYPRFIRF